MKIRVYYNVYISNNDKYQTLTAICDTHELPQFLTYLQSSSLTEFCALEIIPE